MTLNAMNWNIQQDGDDNNGGGYRTTDPNTDYSLQTSAQLTVTDGATSGIGVTTLTSATGGFTSAMVGNVVHIYSGTNLTDGWYEIATYVDTNTVTLDRAPDDGVGGVSGATCKVGGALATVGGMGAVWATEAATRSEPSRAWIKYNATDYALTTASYNVAGGSFKQDNAWNFPMSLRGYETIFGDNPSSNKPTINVGIYNPSNSPIWLNESGGQDSGVCSHVKVDGNLKTSTYGFYGGDTDGTFYYDCEAIDCVNGWFVATTIRCVATGCTSGYQFIVPTKCVAVDCSNRGFNTPTGMVADCLAYECGIGFESAPDAIRCVAADCTGDGFEISVGNLTNYVDCVATSNGGYGFDVAGRSAFVNCYTYNNTSGASDISNLDYMSGPDEVANITELSGSPWVDASADQYWLNDTAGAGATLRAAGIKLPLSGVVDEPDIAATQHADSAGGSSSGQTDQNIFLSHIFARTQ